MHCPESCECSCLHCEYDDCCRGRFTKKDEDDFDADELGLDPEDDYDA